MDIVRSSSVKAINHVAVSVPDLDKAIKWYHEVLGFNVLTEQIEGTSDNSHLGRLLSDIFGAILGLAHMTFKNEAGFEVFEFIEPKDERPSPRILENKLF